jgi:hypothetical protein
MQLDPDGRLYLGPAGLASALQRRATEASEDGSDLDAAPPGPIVVMIAENDAYTVLIDPPLPCGDHRQSWPSKERAWQEARELWSNFRLGFAERSAQDQRA